jgi:DmsE family decaheme c-type cytochrome
MTWKQSDHAAAPLACFACHTDVVHFKTADAIRPPVALRAQQGFCQQCHGLDTLGFRQVFHHPVPEGAMDCTACHAVHGKLERDIALDQGGACARCHRRQVEARVFQHTAMQEGCLTCHQAHGSPLRALLTEPGNTLCLKCHVQAGFPVIEGVDHSVYLARGAQCYDCHVDVHGSNTDPSLLGRLR